MYMHDNIFACDQEREMSRRCQAELEDSKLKQIGYEGDVCDKRERFRKSGCENEFERGHDDSGIVHVLAWTLTASG
jgi:hypothetical protein